MFTEIDDSFAQIKVAAAGEAGDRIAATLSKLIADIECLPDETPFELTSGAIAQADMVVIVSGMEDEAAAARAVRLAALARESELCVITLALVTRSAIASSGPVRESLAELRGGVDALFEVSDESLVPLDEQAPRVMTSAALEEYLVRLQVSDLARMITERGIICMDFADVRAIMHEGGSEAYLGVGIAGGENAARDAALKALYSLQRQGVNPAEIPAFLVSVTGSTNMVMDQFDTASKVVHEAIDEESNIISTLLIDDALAGNIRVLIMAKGNSART